jgi:hypothetical protein
LAPVTGRAGVWGVYLPEIESIVNGRIGPENLDRRVEFAY